ncbi:hypothetical protein [Tessaracoccus massiliensis]|uniref:hypothetical protein n=1 Tax=Tessaracoccus massiliensis TaxID=1522311 RepID=UPI00058DF414|nr:hypothetical protein [Tessaracoccus massiliensis]
MERVKNKMLAIAASAALALSLAWDGGPAHADEPQLEAAVVAKDTVAPYSYTYSGLPNATVTATAQKLEQIANANPDVFTGLVFADRYTGVEVYYAKARAADAKRLVDALALPPVSYTMHERTYSQTELLAMMNEVATALETSGLPWNGIAPNAVLDGIVVSVSQQPDQATLSAAAETLAELGVVRFVLDTNKIDLYEPGIGNQVNVYITPGVHVVNGRIWRTECEPYSQTSRCRTEISATVVSYVDGKFVRSDGFAFNSLSYLPAKRALWTGNPLATTGEWTAADGRKWRTECDTLRTGRGACRTWAWADFIKTVQTDTGTTYQWTADWVFNNLVYFDDYNPNPTWPAN